MLGHVTRHLQHLCLLRKICFFLSSFLLRYVEYYEINMIFFTPNETILVGDLNVQKSFLFLEYANWSNRTFRNDSVHWLWKCIVYCLSQEQELVRWTINEEANILPHSDSLYHIRLLFQHHDNRILIDFNETIYKYVNNILYVKCHDAINSSKKKAQNHVLCPNIPMGKLDKNSWYSNNSKKCLRKRIKLISGPFKFRLLWMLNRIILFSCNGNLSCHFP